MKKHIFFCLTISMFCGALSAQNVKLGVKGGALIPNLITAESTPVSDGFSSRVTPGVGLFTELSLNEKWSLRLGVEYNELGGKKDGMQAMPTERLVTSAATALGMGADAATVGSLVGIAVQNPLYYANVDTKISLDYVLIPVLAQYQLNLGASAWSLNINAGPYVSFLVSAEQHTDGNSRIYADPSGSVMLWDRLPADVQTALSANPSLAGFASQLQNESPQGKTDISGEMKTTNFGLMGNLGLRYKCNSNNYFFVEAGGNYGLVPLQTDDKYGSFRVSSISIMLGYAFSLF